VGPREPAVTFDVGTNTLIMLVASLRQDGSVEVLHDLARIVRLGEGVDATGKLSGDATRRTLAEMRNLVRLARKLKVPPERSAAVGTAALRDAIGADRFLKDAAGILGHPLEVIAGDEEARLTWLAVARGLAEEPGTGPGPRAVVDIGGGSTEVVLGRGDDILSRKSINIGSVRMTERHVTDDPPRHQVPALRAAIRAELAGAIPDIRPSELVGVAGTVTTLGAIAHAVDPYDPDRVHGIRLHRPDLETLLDDLSGMTLEDRRDLRGLEPKRADVIVAGAAILLELLNAFGAASVRVCDHGVRYGLWHDRFGG